MPAALNGIDPVAFIVENRLTWKDLQSLAPGAALAQAARTMAQLQESIESCRDKGGLDANLQEIPYIRSTLPMENILRLIDQNVWIDARPLLVPFAQACQQTYQNDLRTTAVWVNTFPKAKQAAVFRDAETALLPPSLPFVRAARTLANTLFPSAESRTLAAIKKEARQMACNL